MSCYCYFYFVAVVSKYYDIFDMWVIAYQMISLMNLVLANSGCK